MEGAGGVVYENDLNLRLGLPGTDVKNQEKPVSSGVGNNLNKKRPLDEITREDSVSVGKGKSFDDQDPGTSPSPPKAQIVGWPPVRSYRKNTLQQQPIYVKVSMDGAPYLRKIDIKVYKNYPELLQALETMFKFTMGEYSGREGYTGSEYVPTYEDKDGDWMLVGDVPWSMFMSSCKRLRVMKGSEAKGLGCDAS